MHTESIGGRKYFVMSIHDCAVYFPRHKSKVLEKFKRDATNESGRTIGHCKQIMVESTYQGIRRELTIAHTPGQNGVAERMN